MQQPCSPPKPLLFPSAIPLSLFSSFNTVSSSTLGLVPLPCSTTSSKRLPNPHSLPWPARPWTPDPDRLPLPVALQALPSQDNNNSSSNNKTAPVLQSESQGIPTLAPTLEEPPTHTRPMPSSRRNSMRPITMSRPFKNYSRRRLRKSPK
ncbi:hypothetical protein K457DRAFT_845635 [Linnemannia elongata AG-77]|uniref:Uncharacterized protein n=1 Tax=Linnemannia elongata AG-77 TaxID=1314771 RepID=A0A197JIT9_9FUNG|nr:hypothetical protein K457DRAFT_845635 [Linnemannia elongata AG-77]